MKKSLLRTILGSVAVTMVAGSQATPITPEQALARFEKSSDKNIKHLAPSAGQELSLRFTGNVKGIPVGYVFADSSSQYYVLAADDSMPAVLGYGTGVVSDNVPPALEWWLQLCAESDGTADVPTHAAISPMVQTKWNQLGPYYDMCPMDGDSRSVTGCMATSVAQVVHYHRLPAGKGTGVASYTWNNQTLSFDYSSTSFDWDNMLNVYGDRGTYTDVQGNAVAQLMVAIGIGEQMNYSSQESGASSVAISPLLYQHLGFDKGVALMKRDYFSADDWDAMMYGELEAGRPIVYSGQATEGGHSFVCDGYDGNGYYHINWGWSGYYDGYFLLSNLTPSGQGTGGYEGGYNSRQDAEIGIQPPVEGSEIFLPLYATAGFAYNSTYNGYGFGEGGGYLNYSTVPMTFSPGLRLVRQADTRADESEEYYVAGDPVTFSGASGSKLSGHVYFSTAPLFSLEPGTYEAYPVAKLDGSDNWQKIYVPAADTQFITVRLGDNGVVTYDGSDPDAVAVTTTITDILQTEMWVTDETGIMQTTFSNTSSAAEDIKLSFVFTNQATGKYYEEGTWNVSIPAGTVTYNLQFEVEMPSGTYSVYAMNGTNKISDTYTMYVDNETSVANLIEQVDVKYYNLQGLPVLNPEKGGIYILTNGKKSQKVRF